MTGVVLNIPDLPGESGLDGRPQSISAAAACAVPDGGEADGVFDSVPNSEEGAVRDAAAATDGFGFGLATGFRRRDLASEFRRRDLAGHGEYPCCGIPARPDERGATVVQPKRA